MPPDIPPTCKYYIAITEKKEITNYNIPFHLGSDFLSNLFHLLILKTAWYRDEGTGSPHNGFPRAAFTSGKKSMLVYQRTPSNVNTTISSFKYIVTKKLGESLVVMRYCPLKCMYQKGKRNQKKRAETVWSFISNYDKNICNLDWH